MTTTKRIALVQAPPVLLDRSATLQRALDWVDQAAEGGAGLVAFPEAFVPGYPAWVWNLRAGLDRAELADLHLELQKQAVDLQSDMLDELRQRAAQRQVVIGIGINELDSQGGRATLYNSYLLIGTDGGTLLHHRKLIPTNPERTIWGRGDGSGRRVVDTPVGRGGVLLCWESYMPLARAALYDQGLDIYLAPTWDRGPRWEHTMHHIASESGAWVASVASAMGASDLPERLKSHASEFERPGGSMVIQPFGDAIVGPVNGEVGLVYGDLDLDEVKRSRRSLDVAGHYGRPDLFQLQVDRRRMTTATFLDDELPASDRKPARPGSSFLIAP